MYTYRFKWFILHLHTSFDLIPSDLSVLREIMCENEHNYCLNNTDNQLDATITVY